MHIPIIGFIVLFLTTISDADLQNVYKWDRGILFTTLFQKDFNSVNKSLITEIDLRSIAILRVEWSAFSGFNNLRVLKLNNNRLTSWNVNILPQLLVLDLSHNFFETFEEQTFQTMPSLKELRLDNNRLQNIIWELKSESFNDINLSYNKELRSVHISSNSLQYLSLQNTVLDSLHLKTPNLKLLDLRDSTFHCIANFTSICRSSITGLKINYTPYDKESTSYDCPKLNHDHDSMIVDTQNTINNNEQVSVGCLTTLRRKMNDVVISETDYNKIKLSLYGLILISILLSISLIITTQMYILLGDKPKSHHEVFELQIIKREVINS